MLKPQWSDTSGPDWQWSLAISLLLGVGRWPTWFVTREFNVDESLMIAGASTLRHDPVFFRAVDGGTAGPLDFYALLPVGWLHGADDFASARITALILIGAALIFVHQTLAHLFGRQVARISTFSATYLESFTLHEDFLHYATELVAVALLAFAFWAGTRRFVTKASWSWNIVGGLALGAVPFGKLQAAPAALLLGVFWIAGEIGCYGKPLRNCGRNLTALCAAALAPLIFVAVVLTVTNQWNNAIIPYVLSNINYLNTPMSDTPHILAAMWVVLGYPGTLFAAWMTTCGLWLLLTVAVARVAGSAIQLMALAAISFLLISALCVLAPHRPALHYCQLLLVPGTLVFGCTTGIVVGTNQSQTATRRCGLLCAALLCSVGPMIYDRANATPYFVGSLAEFQEHRQGLVAMEIMKYAKPGEALGTWGWMTRCYAETGLRQATRGAASLIEIEPGPYQNYYQNRYLADFKRSSPPVFVDAVGQHNFYFEDPRQAHDRIFPAFAEIIRTQYTQVADINNSRIYVRNDRLALITSQSDWRHTH